MRDNLTDTIPRFDFSDPDPVSLPRITFPKIDQPAGDWAKAVLQTPWDFEVADDRHTTEEVRKFLRWFAEHSPSRRGFELTPRESDLLERCMTAYRRAFHAAQRGARRRPR